MPEPIAPVTTPATTEPPAAATTPPVPTPPSQPAAPAPTGNVWDDPQTAQAEIEKLRRERGAERTTAKAQAAEDAKKELAQEFGKILGLVADDAADPVKLAASLTASQADTKQARVELAVFRNANTAGGDPAALLDSAKFLTDIASIDPADPAAITAAIQAAVAANPRLGAAPAGTAAPQPPAPIPGQGAGGNGAPNLDTQIAEATAAGDHLRAIALKQQRAALNKS